MQYYHLNYFNVTDGPSLTFTASLLLVMVVLFVLMWKYPSVRRALLIQWRRPPPLPIHLRPLRIPRIMTSLQDVSSHRCCLRLPFDSDVAVAEGTCVKRDDGGKTALIQPPKTLIIASVSKAQGDALAVINLQPSSCFLNPTANKPGTWLPVSKHFSTHISGLQPSCSLSTWLSSTSSNPSGS